MDIDRILMEVNNRTGIMLGNRERYRILNIVLDIGEIVGVKDRSKNIRCMFHDDSKPSAHIYDNRIYCFACGRFYSVVDVLLKQGKDINKIFDSLVSKYGLENLLKIANENKKARYKYNMVKRLDGEGKEEFTYRYFKNLVKGKIYE